MQIDELKSKKILILGLGLEGASTLTFLRTRFPTLPLTVADKNELHKLPEATQILIRNDRFLTLNLGPNYLNKLNQFDLVIKTPGISPYQTPIQTALKQGVEFSSQTKLFFDNFKGRIIGVTGTKGKSTTTSLIFHILKNASKDIVIGGNIGKPALELLDDPHEWAVLELSSHQLWDLKISPHISVLLNIYKDHLDYSDFPHYFETKKNIARFQLEADFFVYNDTFPELVGYAKEVKSKKVPFAQKIGEIMTRKDLPLFGNANLQNMAAARTVAEICGVSDAQIEMSLKSFTPLPGRLEKVGEFDGLTIYEDYLATIPEATLNALVTFAGQVKCLYLGGHERNQDYTKVLETVITQQIPLLILFPQNGSRIQAQLEHLTKEFKPQTFLVSSMEEAVRLMYTHTPEFGVVLFSTGAPSFGMFKSYEDRSQQFHFWLKKRSPSTAHEPI